MRRGFYLLGAVVVLIAPRLARAEESIIKFPGEHPTYFFEAEPHLVFGFPGRLGGNIVPGVGFRGTFIIVQNGFIPSINNSVGIGVGGDLFFQHASVLDVPVVMQWNFYLSTHWSVFGEPGLGVAFGDGGGVVHPVFDAGGRYHFSEKIALTMRLGYPAASVGVSILF
jgi:hypothetical protein